MYNTKLQQQLKSIFLFENLPCSSLVKKWEYIKLFFLFFFSKKFPPRANEMAGAILDVYIPCFTLHIKCRAST